MISKQAMNTQIKTIPNYSLLSIFGYKKTIEHEGFTFALINNEINNYNHRLFNSMKDWIVMCIDTGVSSDYKSHIEAYRELLYPKCDYKTEVFHAIS